MAVFLFDLMDTVVRDPFHRVKKSIEDSGLSFQEWMSFRNRSAFEAFEEGRIPEAEYFSTYYKSDLPSETLNKLIQPEQVKAMLYDYCDFIPGMENILKQLQETSTLVITSNYSVWFSEILRLRPEIPSYFSEMIFSCKIGKRKPKADYYQEVGSRVLSDVNSNDPVFFIDDRDENLIQPRKIGWNTHRFESTENFLKFLNEFGIQIQETL